MSSLTAIGRFVSRSRIRPETLIWKAQMCVVLAALALPLTAWPQLDFPLNVPGPISVFPSDIVVGLGVALWVAGRILAPGSGLGTRLRTPVLGLPLLAFGVLLIPGIVRGHERYGAPLLAQPLRLAVYAAIAFAMTDLRPKELYRGIVAVAYAGAAWQAILALYYLNSGRSQTQINDLSTGGQRVLSLTTGMYLAAALVLAVINLEVERRRWWRALHMAAGATAAFGVVMSFGRTSFLALILLLPFLVWQLPETRGNLARTWRWSVPALMGAIVATAVLAPSFRSTFIDRVSANPLTDHSIRWRERRMEAALSGMKSGRWQAVTEDTALSDDNVLVNPGFEDGLDRWYSDSAYMTTIDSNNPTFGKQTLDVLTSGLLTGEGFSSTSVPASEGQTWTFSVWLKGTSGNEHVAVAIREYDSHGRVLVNAGLPVILTITPSRYFVRWTLADSDTTRIQASVRTVSRSRVEYLADDARLTHDVASKEAVSANPAAPEGGVLSPVFGDQGWQPAARLEPTGPDNLKNGTFESGMEGWVTQEATARLVPSESERFGSHSVQLSTAATAAEEGIRSAAVPVETGQTYTFQVWLYSKLGERPMFVSLWQYDKKGRRVSRVDFPVNLTETPTRYSVTTQITNEKTENLRALIRTQTNPQVTSVYMDNAKLRLRAKLDSLPDVHLLPPPAPPAAGWQIDEPLLGLGFGRSVDYTWDGRLYTVEGDPDNSYVFLLAGGGILALGGFLFLMAAHARDAWRLLGRLRGVEHILVAWALAAWFLVLVNAGTAPYLPRPKIILTLWVLLLIPAAVRAARERSEDNAGSGDRSGS